MKIFQEIRKMHCKMSHTQQQILIFPPLTFYFPQCAGTYYEKTHVDGCKIFSSVVHSSLNFSSFYFCTTEQYALYNERIFECVWLVFMFLFVKLQKNNFAPPHSNQILHSQCTIMNFCFR